jgi:citrate synthase
MANPRPRPPETSSTLTHVGGAEAARILGVKPQTLYAYVSRGLIRSVATAGSARRLYSRADIEKLRARASAHAGHGPAAASAMHYGDPIIQTTITEITPQGPWFRGRSAIALARAGRTFENVAELLWTGRDFEQPIVWELDSSPPDTSRFTACLSTLDSPLSLPQAMSFLTLSINMLTGHAAQRLRYTTSIMAARQLIFALTGCFGYLRTRPAYVHPRPGLSIAEEVVQAVGLRPSAERLRGLNALMVLLADHELSPATFAARIAASGGADLYTCLVCALESGAGPKVSEIFDRLQAFLAEGETRPRLIRRLGEMQALGQLPPGFNHPAYPGGDPRAELLFQLARSIKSPAVPIAPLCGFFEDAQERFGLKPRLEAGATILSMALGLPHGTATGLYSLARVAGWTAHVIEQRMSSSILRPRAKYVGDSREVPAGLAGS